MVSRARWAWLLALLLPALPCHAQGNELLARARAAMAALDLDTARVALDQALTAGGNGPADVAEIHRLAGQVAASMDRAAAAEDHFRRLLTLDPEVRLREGLSPKITAPFRAAQAWLAAHGALRLRVETESAGVVLVVASDPLAMVAGARVHDPGEHGHPHAAESRGRTRIRVPLPSSGRRFVTVFALDEHGNRLAALSALVAPAMGGPAAPERSPEPRPARRWIWRWPPWTAAAVAFAGGGVVFGIRARDAEHTLAERIQNSSDYEYHDDVAPLERRGRRDALLANIGVGLAAGCAVTAVVLGVLELGGGTEANVAVIAGPGRLAVEASF